jgi:predicted phosphodiesterase
VSESLADRLLAKPVGPAVSRPTPEKDYTRKVEVKGDSAEVTINAGHAVDECEADAALRDKGLDPLEWEVTGFRTSEWTMANGTVGESARFTFRRIAQQASRAPLDELIAGIEPYFPVRSLPQGEHGYIVALGDMQFGKIDGDGVEGTLRRTIECINRAADLLDVYASRFDIGHVHVAWLGDHVEGFVSQGGANTYRTVLTMNEQIRLTRRVMLHALQVFAFRAERVSMAAVPGNHGEPQRFQGKGVTRYDDSHDTESLIAVADAAALNPGAFGHVEFYVPETDEMTVVIDVAGTTVGHVHGHQFRPGKHFDWWEGQAFHNPRLHDADLLLAGHLHHEFIEANGPRKFIQVPSMESESTWFRHSTGTTGSPGLLVAITKDGTTTPIEHVRGQESEQ